jgi:hypothetical protein
VPGAALDIGSTALPGAQPPFGHPFDP